MSWISKPVQDRFLAFLRSVNIFRENYVTHENQAGFGIIVKICENITALFDSSEPPSEPDTKMSSLSTAIQTQLPRFVSSILNTKMNDDNFFQVKVLERMGAIINDLNRVVSAYEKDLAKLHKIPLSPRESDFEITNPISLNNEILDNLQLLRVLPVRVLFSESESSTDESLAAPLLKKPEPASIQTSSSCFSFFNRAMQTCTKTMVSGVSLGTLGLGYLGLSYMSKYLGDDLDALIKTDQTGLDHQMVIAAFLMLISVTLSSIALVRSRHHEVERDIESARPNF